VSTYIGATPYSGTAGSTEHTFSRDFGTGSNKRAFIPVKSGNSGNNPTSVTVGGNAATLAATTTLGNHRVYVIDGVGNGAQDIVINYATTNVCSAVCAQWNNCGALGEVVIDQSNTQTPSVVVSSASGETVIGGGLATYGTLLITPGAGQTERYDAATDGINFWFSDEPGASSVTHSYSMDDFAFDAQLIWGVSAQTAGSFTANLFLGDNAVSGQNFGELELAAPTTATSPTGWTVAGLAAGQMARMAFGVERAAGTFSGTAQPSGAPDAALGDGFRTAATLNGSYAAGTWTIQVPMLAVDAAGANLRARIRLWRSANADMSGATEITSGAVIGTTITALGTVTPQISTCTVALGTVTLTNEYLFLQVAAEIV
jgi:hypothetical protein